LLGNETDPWSATGMPGVGDPHGIDAPAVDPAEWASPEQQQSQASGMGATGSAMPGVPGANAAGGTSAERSDASGLLGTETDPWAGASPVAGDPTTVDAPAAEQAVWASADHSAQVESIEDRVAVVKPSEHKEDTAAWDLVAGAGALAFLVPFAVSQANKGKEQSEEELTPEYTLRETEPWEGAAETELTTYRRKKGEEGTAIVEDRPPPMCSDALPPEPEVAEPEEELDDDEEPRTAANLLKQTDDAWGKSGTKPLGVLE
jgi:hypothetical protein